MPAAVSPLEESLRARTRPGELCERLKDGSIRCLACGHLCRVRPGQRGICFVRYHDGADLRVPWGYVGGLQVDPIEKKPFFHALPGARAMSFGMLGCDLRCPYCQPPDAEIATDEGLVPIGEIAQAVTEGAAPRVFTPRGRLRRATGARSRSYTGDLVEIRPAYLPPIRTTPEHPILVRRADGSTAYAPAGDVTTADRVAVPAAFEFSRPQVLDVAAILGREVRDRTRRHKIGPEVLRRILDLSRRGVTSREIGDLLGLDPSHVRHLRSRLARGVWDIDRLWAVPGRVVREGDRVRFAAEGKPGIPARLDVDADLAALLGTYCAEGSVVRSRRRPNSLALSLSFGHGEAAAAEAAAERLRRIFGVRPRILRVATGIRVDCAKASVAAFIGAVCGVGAAAKRAPAALFDAPRHVVEAFLEAYVAGDGWRRGSETTTTTVSRRLAHDVAFLVLKTGRTPALYEYAQPVERRIEGRPVRQRPRYWMVRWRESERPAVIEADGLRFLPIRSVRRVPYDGPVLHLEVDEDEAYLAPFLAVHNCQNADTSQVLRDPAMVAYPRDATPAEIVRLARRYGADVVTSTYNEPLITSEWGAAVMRAAKESGLVGSYVSNGNGTPEVLAYIRPWVDLYKVDLKGFDPRRYTDLGGRLGNVLRTIRLLVKMDFWVEIVTLCVPGFNDSDEELGKIAAFLASVSPDLPWHVTAFHPDYKMTDRDWTPAETLLRAARIGEAAGLRFVYAGNIPGAVGRYEDTRCPGCGATLIRRRHFTVLENRLRDGSCPDCARPIPGFWRTAAGFRKVPPAKAPVQAAWERGEAVDLPEAATIGAAP